jgi:hypothetical protein
MTSHRAIRGLVLASLVIIARPSFAQCAFALSGVTSGISTINFIPEGAEPFGTTLQAVGDWAFGCEGIGGTYPSLMTGSFRGASDVLNVYVFYHVGKDTVNERCGYTDVLISPTTGQITGATVHMWEQQGDGADCTSNMENLVTHEIGHVLGLGDVDQYTSCNGTIMGSNPSFISTDQCALVQDTWLTPTEEQQLLGYCNTGNGCTPGYVQPPCSNEGATDECGCCLNYSPILIDLVGSGIRMTDAEHGAIFDINGVPDYKRLGWPQDGSAAWLACDRNSNGHIDNGRELFGNATPTASGSFAQNGYEALADLDGDGDGWIDGSDLIFAKLVLWRDFNHDGMSEPGELVSLADAGVIAISTAPELSARRDAFGNSFRYRSKVIMTTAPRVRFSYDVFPVAESIRVAVP